MQNNERLNQVGLKLAFAEQTLKQQTSLKKSVHLPDSDVWLDFVETAWSIGELHWLVRLSCIYNGNSQDVGRILVSDISLHLHRPTNSQS